MQTVLVLVHAGVGALWLFRTVALAMFALVGVAFAAGVLVG